MERAVAERNVTATPPDARVQVAAAVLWPIGTLSAPPPLRPVVLAWVLTVLIRLHVTRATYRLLLSVTMIVGISALFRSYDQSPYGPFVSWLSYVSGVVAAVGIGALLIHRVEPMRVAAAVRWWLNATRIPGIEYLGAVVSAAVSMIADAQAAITFAQTALHVRTAASALCGISQRPRRCIRSTLARTRLIGAGTLMALWSLPEQRADALALRGAPMGIPASPWPNRPWCTGRGVWLPAAWAAFGIVSTIWRIFST